MGALFRGEQMELLQLFIQPEAAYHIIAELGESGCVQFRDLNEEVNLYQREYSNEVKRVNEMERQLRYIETEIKKKDIRIQDISVLPKAPNPREIVNLEAHLEKTERDIRELSEGGITLKKQFYERIQHKHVLQKAQTFFHQQDEAILYDYTPEEMKHASQLGFIGGVINKDKLFAFERLLWRMGRGNVFLRYADIEELILDPETNKETRTAAFIAFFQGENLADKITKICTGFKVSLVDIPMDLEVRTSNIKRVSTEVADLKTVINQTEDHKQRVLISVAKDIQNWIIMVQKMKAIYYTLNLLSHDVSRKCLIAEGWVPKCDLTYVDKALSEGSNIGGSSVPSFYNTMNTKQTPPTYDKTNKFTQGFQNLISAYAFSSYRELNPALYTIITFPFLFAIMFGDLGHGIILFCAGLALILSEKKIAAQKNMNEIFSIFFGGRYIILLMGLFSMYTGLIYNDLFSKSMNIFGSHWKINSTNLTLVFKHSEEKNEDVMAMLIPRNSYKGSPYILGLDPIWQSADNKIIFLNSFKMKLSIIFGVVHMSFGLILSVVNFIHLKKPLHILLDFLPKILFFAFLFVYLVSLMFIKWFMYTAMNDTNIDEDTKYGSSCAPNVLIFFIGMVLFKKSDIKEPCPKYLFNGQENVQKFLLIFALLCLPWMLFGVPIHEMIKRRNNKTKRIPIIQLNGHSVETHSHLEPIPESSVLQEENNAEEPMSDLMVHAGIHTIEFTLSTVSHTASYLRLWALSLAHAQLSDVLWTMVFRKAFMKLSYLGAIYIYIDFAVWATITVLILVLMEGLSAFLHTLRLHWVEFMTKFFEGQGLNFEPFSFQRIFDEEREAASN